MASSNRKRSDAQQRKDVGSIGEVLKQTKPFSSDGQEALMMLIAVTEQIQRPFQQLFADQDLTHQQYNVLRILRGAGKDGLQTLEIASRMVERTPGITRLIDRLVKKGLVDRLRSPEDRRQVWCSISAEGRKLLRRVDGPIASLDEHALDPLSGTEVRQLIRLLDKVRAGN